MCEMLELEDVVYWEATKRIPDDLKHTHPYSATALWTYYNRTEREPEGETCNYCKLFDGHTFTGSQLRSVFPDHLWMGADIYPNVHKTLWGIDHTCACLLIREENPEVQPNLNLWSQIGVDWKDKEPKEPQ